MRGISGNGWRSLLRPHEDRVLNFVSGVIPLGVLDRTYGSRALIAGDAAGMVKPTSGGGIYTGVRAARHAAAVAADCCAKGSFRDRDLARYEDLWKEDFGRELAVGMALYRARRGLSAAEVDAILSALRDQDIVREIVEHGDMDRPAALVRRLGMKPPGYPGCRFTPPRGSAGSSYIMTESHYFVILL